MGLRSTACIASIGLFGACDAGPSDQQLDNRKIIVALFDVSSSVKAADVRDLYLGNFAKIAAGLHQWDVIVADSIATNPRASANYPVNIEIIHPNDNRQRIRMAENAARDSARTVVARMLSSESAASVTRILESLDIASAVFANYDRGRRILVVFSDMIEESADYNFRRSPPTQQATGAIIDARRKAGRLPGLAGVTVYIVGAGAGSYAAQLDEARFDAVRDFWRAYFAAAGADLALERYGGGIVRFDP